MGGEGRQRQTEGAASSVKRAVQREHTRPVQSLSQSGWCVWREQTLKGLNLLKKLGSLFCKNHIIIMSALDNESCLTLIVLVLFLSFNSCNCGWTMNCNIGLQLLNMTNVDVGMELH